MAKAWPGFSLLARVQLTIAVIIAHFHTSDNNPAPVKMAAISAASSVFVGKAVKASQIRAKAPKASVVVKASASDNKVR